MLAKAIRNQAEDGPSTRRAAIRAFKHLHAIVRQHGPQLHWYMRPPKNTPPAAKVPKKLSNTGHARKNSLLSHHNSHLSCYTACPLAWPVASGQNHNQPGTASQWLTWQAPVFAESTPYRNLECGRAKSGSETWWRVNAWQGQVWKEAWKPQVGRRELRNTKPSPRKGRKRQKTPPIQCATHPIGHPQGGLLSITLCFSNAGNASAAIFWWFLASVVVLRRFSGIRRRHPRVRDDMWIKMAGFPDLALRRCCLYRSNSVLFCMHIVVRTDVATALIRWIWKISGLINDLARAIWRWTETKN